MKIISLLSLFLFPFLSYSQSGPARVIGSFLYKNSVYNYDFSRDDNNSYSLFITQINDSIAKDKKTNEILDKPNTSEAERGQSSLPKPQNVVDKTKEPLPSSDNNDTVTRKDSAYFSEFSKDIFDSIFKTQMKKKFGTASDQTLQEKSSEVFFSIKSRLDFIEDEPTTAYLILKKDRIYSFLKENSAKYYDGRLSRTIVEHLIHKASVEIDEGTIKNIKVQLLDPSSLATQTVSPRRYLEFKNQFPISISGKFDPDKFANVNMYCVNCYGILGLSRFIKLSDLLIYDIVLENEKEDYSPANKVISLAPHNPIIELRKEKRSKILDISAYTDFVGLDQQQPNGLIQFEVKRRIIINSRHRLSGQRRTSDSSGITMEQFAQRYDLRDFDLDAPEEDRNGNIKYKAKERTKYSKTEIPSASKTKTPLDSNKELYKPINPVLIRPDKFKPINLVWFNNVEFKLQFLKLEENNRILPYERLTLENSKIKISPIDLYKYQINSFGPTFDIFRVNYTQVKFSWNVLNIGINWFNVRVADSTTVSAESSSTYLNNFSIQPGSSITFRPDGRWGVTIGSNYLRQSIWAKPYELSNPHGLLQYHVNAHLKTNEYSRLFFRFRFTHEIKMRSENFTQIQAGYTVDLFSSIGKSNK